MKYLSKLLAIAFVCIFAATTTWADTVIYLVRHAEKQSDGTRDPSLTDAGNVRAQAVAHRLSNAGLTKIYSTNYKRTQETAAPSAQMASLDVTPYDPRALEAFAIELKKLTTPALVVGHSNTTPVVANFLTGGQLPLLEEHQYDHLYVVTLKDDGTASVAIDFIEPRTP